ncbi:hypothetical protein [Arthrobacter sp. Bi83]|uniref:hypothetical protein n=1 Tax=Arthrobacter sp. Bi83 TaxID=2822353 RepID=UPI001E31748F|nr:hypothetical protein [Arthrobacter sp. Bi83]
MRGRPDQETPRRLLGTVPTQIYKDVQDLGPIIPVHPTRLRLDRSRRLAPGQVYVTRTGTLYHPPGVRSSPANGTTTPAG